MRSEGNDAVVDCDDPMTVIACTTNTDACPAACREADDTPSVVKAGDLAVSAAASTDRKIIVGDKGGVSDTDTLTFKSSEEVTITKVVLERYGFSDGSKVVKNVWLEDSDGNVITEPKELNNKDQATLTIKKDYRNVDGTLRATIVVETNTGTATAAGGTMGFKVTDVQSSAENLNLDNYKPYTYDLVVYGGTAVELSRYGNDKNYNYEAGEMYEVARFRVKANNSAVLINGFTLSNEYDGNRVDLQKYLDKVEVTANGEKVSAKYSANKDDQLVITLGDEYRLAAKQNVSFVVSLSLDEFEDYGYGVQFKVNSNDLKAIEEKTETRITVNPSTTETWATHLFRGGKIKLANTKLGNVEAAAGSVNKVVAEGEITLGESVKMPTFKVVASTGNVIEAMTLVVAGEEYDASHDANYKEWTFSKVIIEKSGKVQFKVDLKEEISTGVNEVTFTIKDKKSLDKASFSGAQYEELKNEYVADGDVSGSISFSTLKVQAAKASLENSLSKSKAVEFLTEKGDRKVVFDGTYTAKKGDITLNSFWIKRVSSNAGLDEDVSFYVFIDGEEVGNVDTFKNGETAVERFSDVKVKKDQSVKVRVEAEVESDASAIEKVAYDLYLQGEDEDGNDAGKGSDSMAPISVKASGSVVIPSGEDSNTIKLKGSNETIAYFRVKPSNGAEGIYLDTLALTITGGACTTTPAEYYTAEEIEAHNDALDIWDATTVKSDAEFCTAEDLNATEGPCAAEGATTETVKVGTGYYTEAEIAEHNDALDIWDATTVKTEAQTTCADAATIPAGDVRVNIGDDKDVEADSDGVYRPNTELPKEGVVVEVIYKGEAEGIYQVAANVNNGSATKSFKREFVTALVKVEKQENKGSYTKYTVSVEKFDDQVEVTGLKFFVKGETEPVAEKATVSNGDTFSADNKSDSRSITSIMYNGKTFLKSDYEDFFVAADGEDLRVFSSK